MLAEGKDCQSGKPIFNYTTFSTGVVFVEAAGDTTSKDEKRIRRRARARGACQVELEILVEERAYYLADSASRRWTNRLA